MTSCDQQSMPGVLGFLIAIAFAVVVLVAGRWLASVPFGERNVLAAMTPWAAADGRLRAARAAGAIAGWYFGIVLVAAAAAVVGGTTTVDETSMRVTVSPSGPGARAGLRNGDRVIAVEGEPVTDWDRLRSVVGRRAGEPTHVTIERSGTRVEIEAVPQSFEGVGKLMIGPYRETRPTGIGEAIGKGLSLPFAVVASTARAFVRILLGSERVEVTSGGAVAREASKAPSIATGMTFGAVLAAYFWPMVAFVNVGFAFIRRRAARAAGS